MFQLLILHTAAHSNPILGFAIEISCMHVMCSDSHTRFVNKFQRNLIASRVESYLVDLKESHSS